MNHITQEPKSLYLAVELEHRREYEAAHELRTMQARIAELEAAAHHAEYKMEGWLCKQYPLEACLYPESKDWVEGDYRDRVEWLHTMYEAVKSEVEQLKAKLYAIGIGGVGQSIQPPVQADTEAPLRCDVCGVECANPWHFSTETKRHKHSCDACWNRMKIQGQVVELDHTPAAHQEPVAWIEHEWSGTGLRHLHFEKREPMVRDEVVNPVWTPLYTAPPQLQPLTDEQMWADDGIMRANAGLGLLMKDIALLARAIEEAHGITENLHCKSNQKRLATLWGYVKQDLAHQPLTDEQIIEIADKTQTAEPGTDGYILPISFAHAIEQAHGITGGR